MTILVIYIIGVLAAFGTMYIENCTDTLTNHPANFYTDWQTALSPAVAISFLSWTVPAMFLLAYITYTIKSFITTSKYTDWYNCPKEQ